MREKEREFKRFFDEHFKLIFNYLSRRINIQEDVEEIAFDVFSSIWNQWDSIDKKSSMKPYLFRMCLNKFNDYLRAKYKIEKQFSYIDEETLENYFYEPNIVQENVFRKELELLVENLNDKDKRLYNLKYKLNLSYNQIAKEVGQSVGNIKIQNNRLIKKLKRLWETKEII